MNDLITITREGTKVRVAIQNGPLDYTYFFYYECGSDAYASLLSQHFRNSMQTVIQQIREEEYNLGYKHGRGKVAKNTWFSWAFKKLYK